MNIKTCTTYSLVEVAEVLGVSRPTAYRLARRGEFWTIRVGKSIRVPAGSLAAWARDIGYDELADAIENERGSPQPTTARAAPSGSLEAQTAEHEPTPGVQVP